MNNNSAIASLSGTEAELVARLTYEGKDIVTAKELDTFLPQNFPYRNQLVYSLKNKRIFIPLKRGVYIFVPLDAVLTGRRVSEFLIPPVFFSPGEAYYIGYSTMFNFYNFIDQQFQTVYVVNLKISKIKTIAGLTFKFIKISPEKMYGLEKINIKGWDVWVSSKERTLVDLVYYNKPVGGIDEAAKIVERFAGGGRCDMKKLIDYSTRFPAIKTRKRIGLALEKAGVKAALLRPLEQSVQGTSLISFSDDRRGKICKKWGAIVNDPQ